MSQHDYPELTDIAPEHEDPSIQAPAPAQDAQEPEGAVLELVERGHRLAMALPVFAWPCTIGRAATNDLVLTDPSIGPSHVRLHRLDAGQASAGHPDAGPPDAGQYEVEVLDSTNGVWHGRRHYGAGERFVWQPGQRLTLGRGVQLNLRSTAQPLPATQRWRPFSRAQGLLTAMALVLLVLLSAWTTWLGATETGALARQLPAILLWMLGGLLVWTLGWSMMGKLFTGVTGFWRHVCIASVGMVAMALLDVLLSVTGFAMSWPLLSRFASLASFTLMAVVIWFHLRAATLVSARTLALAVGGLLVLGIGAKLGLQWQTQKRLGDNLYMSTMLPPEWRWAPTTSVDQFMQGTDSMREQLQNRSQLEKDDDEEGDDSGLD
ncbi:FHA domain-containing protein [Comamonas sediminis]|uniref:FHA domain-containing protein n=1 Tax=Comamonas sediminis TaxID=1783360 RepID=A0ABV4B5F4_9BURK